MTTEAPKSPTAGTAASTPSLAPLPTARTIRQRTSLPVQAFRFGAVSIKMMRMVLRSHH